MNGSAGVLLPTSEAERDRVLPAEAPPEAVEPAPSPFARFAAGLPEMQRLMEEYKTSRARLGAAHEERAASIAPAIGEARTALDARGALPAPPATPALAPPPSRALTEFLAPVEGQSPTASVQKMMTGLGLFAQMAGALARGHAASGLAAWTGALQGWQAGDTERSARAYADWRTNTDRALTEWKLEQTKYDTILKASDRTIEDKLRLIRLATLESDNKIASAALESDTLEKFVKMQGDWQKHVAEMEVAVGKIDAARDAKANEWKKGLPAQVVAFLEGLPHIRAGQPPSAQDLNVARAVVRAELASDRVTAARAVGLEAASIAQRTPTEYMRRLEDTATAQAYITEMSRLTDRVDLNRVVGGLRPWLNDIAQKWDRRDPASAPRLNQGALGPMSPDELRLLALVQDYADTILRLRSGAAINEAEFRRMIGFIPEQAVTPAAFRARLGVQNDLLRVKKQAIRTVLSEGGFRAPDLAAPSLDPDEGWSVEEVK